MSELLLIGVFYFKEAPMPRKRTTANEHNILGGFFFSRGLYDLAIEHFKKAIKKAPSSAAMHCNLGSAYLSKKEYEPALEQFNKALELNQHHARSYYGRGRVLEALELYVEAMEEYSQAIALNPPGSLMREIKDRLDCLTRKCHANKNQ
jgi:tetratricopeptide (TPR) repeat protein